MGVVEWWRWLMAGAVVLLSLTRSTNGQCPWSRNYTALHADCICNYNIKQELSIQCSEITYKTLISALGQLQSPIDLLYVNNSTIGTLPTAGLATFQIKNIQFSNCKISSISSQAFQGQEETLRNLNLQDNLLTKVPVQALRNLRRLSLLDLSNNKISLIGTNSFVTLKLSTLKLADNANLSIHNGAFKGLENSLKNLNLKGVGLSSIPVAMRNLSVLAFLDLAQNNLRQLKREDLVDLESLTALNLERNLLQDLSDDVFNGVNDSLSSLSLLNNLLTKYPTDALSSLTQLRVLDIGFNLMRGLPSAAFKTMSSLTLLALDGNPMESVPEAAFTHLNKTLRGLSIGGRYLKCDCNMAWLLRWIKDFDLQVTSRERNPQFCGFSPKYRSRSFYQLSPEEMICEEEKVEVSSVVTVTRVEVNTPDQPTIQLSTTPRPTTTTTGSTTPTTTTTTTRTTTLPRSTTTRRPRVRRPSTPPPYTTSQRPGIRPYTPIYSSPPPRRYSTVPPRNPGFGRIPQGHKPDIIRKPTEARPNNIKQENLINVEKAYRKDNSVIIKWDVSPAASRGPFNGFRVVYRGFGDNEFTEGPPLAASEKEFQIKSVPSQMCIVVCVIELDPSLDKVFAGEVPFSQCREVTTESTPQSHVDKIIIIASAAICGTVILAVIVFICCTQKRMSDRGKIFAGVSSNPGPPLASLGTLSTAKDWDQMSMYSARSIPRARMYHMEKAKEWDQFSMDRSIPRARTYSMDKGAINASYVPDDARSHMSHLSHISQLSKHKSRSLADGQSQRSYSAMSGRFISQSNLGGQLSRPDSRMDGRSSRASQATRTSNQYYNKSARAKTRDKMRAQRERSRSRSRSRVGSQTSLRSLTHDNTDRSWTDGDHDMDIYVTRNATRQGDISYADFSS